MLTDSQRRILESIRDHDGDPFEGWRTWAAGQDRYNPGGADSAFSAVLRNSLAILDRDSEDPNRYVLTNLGVAQLDAESLVLADGDRWVSCNAQEFPAVGWSRHVARQGALSTACSATANTPRVWRANTKKPACPACVEAVKGGR